MNHDQKPMKLIVIAGLVILGLLIAGSAMQRAAWTQGYTMGLLTSGAEGRDLAPYLLYRAGPGMQTGVGFFGGVLRLGLLLLGIAALFKIFALAFWHRHEGPPHWMARPGPCWGMSDTNDSSAGSSGTSNAAGSSTESEQSSAPSSA